QPAALHFHVHREEVACRRGDAEQRAVEILPEGLALRCDAPQARLDDLADAGPAARTRLDDFGREQLFSGHRGCFLVGERLCQRMSVPATCGRCASVSSTARTVTP